MDEYGISKMLSDSISEAMQEVRNNVSFPIMKEMQTGSLIGEVVSKAINDIKLKYDPNFEITKSTGDVNIKEIIAKIQPSIDLASIVASVNLSKLVSEIVTLPKYDFLSEIADDDFSVEDAQDLYESGKITQEDISNEISEIINNKQFSLKTEWDKFKKSKWFIAIRILITVILLLCTPVGDYAKDKALDKFGVTGFWEDTSIYDLIDTMFGEKEEDIMTESEKNVTVDKNKTENNLK